MGHVSAQRKKCCIVQLHLLCFDQRHSGQMMPGIQHGPFGAHYGTEHRKRCVDMNCREYIKALIMFICLAQP